jgi:hypothetical protein
VIQVNDEIPSRRNPILRKANRIAIANGWQSWRTLWDDDAFNVDYDWNMYIWSDAFCRALWREADHYELDQGSPDPNDPTDRRLVVIEGWYYHRRAMGRSGDALKYLAEHMPAFEEDSRLRRRRS